MKTKCPYGGYLVEDLPKYVELLSIREGAEWEEWRKHWYTATPFSVQCSCGKTVKAVRRSNNWRVPAHRS